MKKFVMLFLVVVLASFSSAQQIVYVGSLGSEELHLFITQLDDEGNVLAYYYPELNADSVELKGTLGDDGVVLEQIQSLSKANTISFKGEILDSSSALRPSYKGIWKDGKNIKDFEINKLVEYVKVDYRQGENISAKEVFPRFLQSEFAPLNNFLQKQAVTDQYNFFTEGQEIANSEDYFNFWEQDCVTSLSYFNASVASVFKSCYSYTGGAHPNTGFEMLNLSFTNHDIEIIRLDQLFDEQSDYQAVISDYLISSLKEQNASGVSSGEITSFAIDELQGFNITNKGLRFSFQPYEVASYAEGPFFVDVPAHVFKDFIDLDSAISFFIN